MNRLGRDVPSIVDLFCGAGGLSLGAARAGFAVTGAVETDPEALATHRANFPGTKHVAKDVSRLTGDSLLSDLALTNTQIDGIVGGPPCQGFSAIGRNDESDPRNGLFLHFFRLVAEVGPRFFLAENVPGILWDAHARLRERAFSLVAKQYVVLPPMVICARDYGAPTTRTRVFFFGYRPDRMPALGVPDFSPPDDVEIVRVRQALHGLPRRISPFWLLEDHGWRVVQPAGSDYFGVRLHGHIPSGIGDNIALQMLKTERRVSGCLGTVHSVEVLERYGTVKPGERDRVSKSERLELDGFCPTLRAGTGKDHGKFQAVRPLHPTVNRVITPREAARLQGFPDWFRFPPTKWHSFRQIGSSVSPLLAERILTPIRRAIELAI